MHPLRGFGLGTVAVTTTPRRPQRFQSGTANPNARLTDEKVRYIIERHNSGVQPAVLARQFNVSYSVIGQIIRNEKWLHIPRPEMTPEQMATFLEKRNWAHCAEIATALRRLGRLERVLDHDVYLTISRADEGWTASAFPYAPGVAHETAIHLTPILALLALADALEVGDGA